uniref:GAG-pre-integrase domain-containing protein n=1 Tax=Oryza brachyantha TaxID=4533 RepID=J3NCU2_ORYBR
MTFMLQSDTSSSKGGTLHVRGRSKEKTYNDSNDRDKNQNGRGRSKSRSKKFCKKKNHFIEDCWMLQNKEKRKSDRKATVVSDAENSDSRDCLVILLVVLVMMNGYLILHVRFISALTEISLVLVRMRDDNLRDLNSAKLYALRGSTIAIVSNDEPSKTNLWHIHLGHMSELGMTELMKRSLLVGCTQDTFNDYCRDEGIVKHHTIPYTPQQSSVAEHMNRTIISKVANTARYLINKPLSIPLDKKTPIEVWFACQTNVIPDGFDEE